MGPVTIDEHSVSCFLCPASSSHLIAKNMFAKHPCRDSMRLGVGNELLGVLDRNRTVEQTEQNETASMNVNARHHTLH